MLKKTIPLFLISALVLGGCMNGDDNNDAVPNNNETPMQDDVQNRDENWTPNANDNNQGGPDLDGMDEGQNGNGGNNNFINGDNGDNGNNGGTAPNDTIIEDDLERNGNNN